MITASKPLLAHTAADLMSPTVVTIPQDMSLQGAAHLLAQADVSGAPVVDAAGRCVGVISARDFLSWAEHGPHDHPHDSGPKEGFCSAWQLTEGETLPTDVVRKHMTADPVTVAPGTLIGALAQMMVDARIHRVIVLDRPGRPIGVISSTDVLAAVARAARSHELHDGDPQSAAEEPDHDPLYSRAP
jgi:CBS-domain-containing membrane protein